MKTSIMRMSVAFAVVGLLVFQSSASISTVNAFDYSHLTPMQKRLLSGLAEFELNPAYATATPPNISERPAAPNPATLPKDSLKNYYPGPDGDCSLSLGSNIKVNQNCLNLADIDLLGRGQAQNETFIAQDPAHPENIVGSYNDYRRGDGSCYGSYSLNSGKNWDDTTIPFSFTRGAPNFLPAERQYWGGGGDTSVAWDTKGNVYFSCQVFNRGAPVTTNPDQSSAMLIFRSTQNNGASWNFPARTVTELNDLAGTGAFFEDKQFMTVDNHPGSPYQDRVYVTWTEFAATGSAYIWEAYSADYGQTFSPRQLVSRASSLCATDFGGSTEQGPCNANQFSQPFTAPDGTLYVVWANYNNVVTGNENRNQIFVAKSTDGGNSFSDPVKAADFYELPDCYTYTGQDLFRACVPEKGNTVNSFFRASNYPVGAVNPKNPKQVVISFGSYINPHSNESHGCEPMGFSATTGQNLYKGVRTSGACNNDILLSISNDSGKTFTGTKTDPRKLASVQGLGQDTTDQWFQWTVFTQEGRLASSYYDRQYGDDEITGFMDFSLSGSDNLKDFGTVRVTSGSMPPPTQFEGVFFGDYTGLSAIHNDAAYPFWSDTRDPNLIVCPGTGTTTNAPDVCLVPAVNASQGNDQDVFVTSVPVPTK